MTAQTPPGFIDASAYLVVEGKRARYGFADRETGLRPVESAQVATLRMNRPATLKRDQIAVKVVVRVPVAAFDPLSPQAIVVIPAELVHGPMIEVTADDATEATS